MATDGGQYRVQIYKFLETELGRELTDQEHNTLRILLKNYVNFKTEKYQKKITTLSNKVHGNKKPRYGSKKSAMASLRRKK